MEAALATREITFRGPGGRTLMGAWGAAKRPRGGVLVIHENRGLNDSIRAVAGRLAASGYSALAIDLLSEEGGTGSFADEFEAMAALGAVPPSRFVADMKAGVTEIRRRLPKKKVAATGFCFGGGMTWLLLASKEARLAAAVPFYGTFPDGGNLAGSKAAVLGIYAELDSRVNASRNAARTALTEGRPEALDRHVPRRRSRVLQPDELTVRPCRGDGRLSPHDRLVRQVRGDLARLRRAGLGKPPATSLEIERHVRGEAVALDVLRDRGSVPAGVLQVCLEVVDEHPRLVRDLCVIHGRALELVDDERRVADVELDPGEAVLLVGERILALRQAAGRLEAECVGEPAGCGGRPRVVEGEGDPRKVVRFAR